MSRLVFVAFIYRVPVCPPRGTMPDVKGECLGAFVSIEAAMGAVERASFITWGKSTRRPRPSGAAGWTPTLEDEADDIWRLHDGSHKTTTFYGHVEACDLDRRGGDRRRV